MKISEMIGGAMCVCVCVCVCLTKYVKQANLFSKRLFFLFFPKHVSFITEATLSGQETFDVKLKFFVHRKLFSGNGNLFFENKYSFFVSKSLLFTDEELISDFNELLFRFRKSFFGFRKSFSGIRKSFSHIGKSFSGFRKSFSESKTRQFFCNQYFSVNNNINFNLKTI